MPRILFLFCVTFKKDQGSEALFLKLAFFFATLTRWIRACGGSFKFLDWEMIKFLRIYRLFLNMGIFKQILCNDRQQAPIIRPQDDCIICWLDYNGSLVLCGVIVNIIHLAATTLKENSDSQALQMRKLKNITDPPIKCFHIKLQWLSPDGFMLLRHCQYYSPATCVFHEPAMENIWF